MAWWCPIHRSADSNHGYLEGRVGQLETLLEERERESGRSLRALQQRYTAMEVSCKFFEVALLLCPRLRLHGWLLCSSWRTYMCSSYKLRTFIDTKLTIIKGCVICIHFVWVNWGWISHNSNLLYSKRCLCLVYISRSISSHYYIDLWSNARSYM